VTSFQSCGLSRYYWRARRTQSCFWLSSNGWVGVAKNPFPTQWLYSRYRYEYMSTKNHNLFLPLDISTTRPSTHQLQSFQIKLDGHWSGGATASARPVFFVPSSSQRFTLTQSSTLHIVASNKRSCSVFCRYSSTNRKSSWQRAEVADYVASSTL
jgi:hypothetical protein